MNSKKYFYADEPDVYDRTVSLTDRSYEMGHDALQYCVAEWIRSRKVIATEVPKILDLGCGTGKEALRLLESVPDCRLVAIDNSELMLSSFRHKVLVGFGQQQLTDRVSMEKADFSIDGWHDLPSLRDSLDGRDHRFNIAVAAHSLHHLTSSQKQRLYGDIAAQLRPGGLFAILDLFDFDQGWLSELSKANLAIWLDAQMAVDSLAADHVGLYPLSKRRELAEVWLDHIRRENAPLPITVQEPTSASEAIDTEMSLLHCSGFEAMEVPFRWFQSGLILATRTY